DEQGGPLRADDLGRGSDRAGACDVDRVHRANGHRPELYVVRESIPGRRVVRPAAAEHRRDDLHLAQLLRLAGERVTVEHDEVGIATWDEGASDALVVRQPG